MTEQERIDALFEQEFPPDMTWPEISKKLNSMPNSEKKRELSVSLCNSICTGFYKALVSYDLDLLNEECADFIRLYNDAIHNVDKEYHFYWAFYYFLNRNNEKCKQEFHAMLQSIDFTETAFGEEDFANLIGPFRNGFDGFWQFITSELQKINTVDGILQLCKIMETYYSNQSNEEQLNLLLSYEQQYPNFSIVNELLGYTYYSGAMWHNAIACLERVENALFFFQDEIYWMLAWSQGKVKNYAQETHYYRLVYDLYPGREFVRNNLGYSLLKQRKFTEAKALFKSCLEDSIDLPHAVYNYIRVLIATGEYAAAKEFVNTTNYHISKSFREKVQNLGDSKKIQKETLDSTFCDDPDQGERFVDFGIKRHQFSSEKLLEDELCARLEAGIPVFGMNLKIYKRKGEYGRQYIIPIGRLDLLCEDADGNLYIVELKKDSGYDDAYKQTAEYLKWFENSDKFKGRKIYGIICLNNPSQTLIRKVHEDNRMKLFEYHISYTER